MKYYNLLLLITLLVSSSLSNSVSFAQGKGTNVLLGKAKLKTIECKKYNYSVTGYVYKNQFVDGQELSLINTSTSDTVFNGIYSIGEGYPCLKGYYYKRSEKNGTKITDGLFFISNDSKDSRVIPNKKKAGKLKMKTIDVLHHKENYENKYPLVFRKTSSNSYELKIRFDDKNLEVIVGSDDIKKYGFYAFSTFVKNSKDAKIIYQNGDVYTGKVDISDITGSICDISFNKRIFIPSKGVTKFADGSIKEGDWLKSYDFKEKVWREIYSNSKTLTDIRDKVYSEKSKLDKLEAAREQRRLEEQRKKEREKQERLWLERQEKLKLEREYQRKCISRFGDYYGKLVFKKEFTLGMNKEMIREILGSTEKLYKKSISSFMGHTIEIWEFNTDLVAQGVSLGGLLGALSYYSGTALEQKCPTLEFTDGKVTSIYR